MQELFLKTLKKGITSRNTLSEIKIMNYGKALITTITKLLQHRETPRKVGSRNNRSKKNKRVFSTFSATEYQSGNESSMPNVKNANKLNNVIIKSTSVNNHNNSDNEKLKRCYVCLCKRRVTMRG